jgi:uncharacterized phage infection (PIP) family protein YhgE
MATKVGELFVNLRADTGQFNRGMRQAQGRTRSLHGALLRLSAVLGAGFGLARAARFVFNATREYQRLTAQLRTFTGSQEAAARSFRQLEQFAKETPFQVEENVQAFIRLRALGLEPTNDMLREFGDIASGMGRRITDFARAVQGAVTGETEALKSFGIVSRIQGEQISFTFDGVTRTVQRDAAEIIRVLREISRENFAGAMQNEMETLNGQISNMGDNLAALARTIGTVLAPTVSGIIVWFTRWVDQVDSLARGLNRLRIEAGQAVAPPATVAEAAGRVRAASIRAGLVGQDIAPDLEMLRQRFGDLPIAQLVFQAKAFGVELQANIDRFRDYEVALAQLNDAAQTYSEMVKAEIQTRAAAAAAAEGWAQQNKNVANLFADLVEQLDVELSGIGDVFGQVTTDLREFRGAVEKLGQASEKAKGGVKAAAKGVSEGLGEASQKAQVMGITVVNAFSRMAAEVASGAADITRSMIRMITTIAAAAAASYLPGGPVIGAAISAIGGIFGQPFHLRRPVQAGADTQFLLREGMLVAENQGFRLVRDG